MSDLRFRGEAASPAESAALDALIDEAIPAGPNGLRHMLLPALHAVHDATGWITPGALDEICRPRPQIDVLLRDETGLPITLAEDPLTAGVMGAGKVLDELSLLKDVTIQ